MENGKPAFQQDWTSTLTEVEQMLERAMNAVQQQQKSLDDYLHSEKASEGSAFDWPKALEYFLAQMQQLPAIADRAGESVAEVDAALADAERELGQWLQDAEAAREKLAGWLAAAE